jgi:hypothetical protein
VAEVLRALLASFGRGRRHSSSPYILANTTRRRFMPAADIRVASPRGTSATGCWMGQDRENPATASICNRIANASKLHYLSGFPQRKLEGSGLILARLRRPAPLGRKQISNKMAANRFKRNDSPHRANRYQA